MSLGVSVIGTAMSRFGPQPDRTLRDLASRVALEALNDSGSRSEDIDLIVFANASGGLYDGQEMIRGEVALRHTPLAGTAIVNVENACASSSSAFQLGCMAIRSGMAARVMVIGAEKMTQEAKTRTYAMLGGAVDLTEDRAVETMVKSHALGLNTGEPTLNRSPFMAIYARRTDRYLASSSATIEDVAMVSVKNRGHAALNERAQFRDPVTTEQVLESRMIADPLRLLMCSPIADGAAALVLAPTDERHPQSIEVLASEIRTGKDAPGHSPVRQAALAAYGVAGIDPSDLDLLEMHDAAGSAELWGYEELGLAPDGEGSRLIRDGVVALGGELPVNTSGGLLAKGHPIGATGCAQLVELTEQLQRRSGPRQVEQAHTALAQNGGGILAGREAVAVITILGRR
jgi:acetyl-CoA acyltransferase